MVLSGVEAVCTLTHPSIRIIHHYGIVKPRQALGYHLGNIGNNLFFYNNSMSVVLRALTERLYFVKSSGGRFVPCPRPTTSFCTLNYFRNAVRRSIKALPTVWTNEEFVLSYTGSKRRRYEKANENLRLRGIRRSDGYWKTFIKAEFYNGTNKNNPCPRLIQPRSPEYNICIGRYLRPAEKLIYKSIDSVYGHHVVLKCDNPWQRAQTIKEYWDAFTDPVFVGLDASRFDQHVSEQALRFEHSLYNALFKSEDLATLLSWQIDNIGYANVPDGSVKYTSKGVRGSGDMNTALGNVFLMCAITHHYLQALPCKWRFINDGDDCGIFLERENLHLLNELPLHHLEYGFEMEVEAPAYEIEQVEFCQSRPIHLGNENWMMVRNIHKAVQQDWINIQSINYASLHEILVATGRCGLALYADLPVLGEMYAAMCRFPSRKKIVDRILLEQFSGIGRTWRMFASEKRMYPVDETEARVSIYKAFGLLPDAQEDMEATFRAMNANNPIQELSPLYSNPQIRVQYYSE